MSIIGTLLGGIIIAAIIAAVVGGFFMWIGANLAGVRRATFGKSIVASVISAIITWAITGAFSYLPAVGNLIGFVLGVVVSIFVIQGIFDVRFGKALLVWVFYVIAQLVAVVLVAVLFGGALLYTVSI